MIGPCLTGQSGGEEEEKKIGKGIAYVKERMNEEKEKREEERSAIPYGLAGG